MKDSLWIKTHCEFSPCRRYRYTLMREWDPHGRTLAAICLNPSTADETQDDPTVAGMVKRAHNWKYGRFLMLNLFAWRSTDPKGLLEPNDPVGPDNDQFILGHSLQASTVICAWGSASPLVQARAEHVKSMLRNRGVKLHYLRMGKTGQPWHPLYLPHALGPTEWENA